jgi:hypothetical protein
MTIINAEELKIHIKAPEKIPEGFTIREDEIKALVGLVNTLGGSEIVRQRIKRILTEVVERTGRT